MRSGLPLVQPCGRFFDPVGEHLADPCFAVEQPTQDTSYFAFAGAGVENSPAGARKKRDEPGICVDD